MVPSANSCVTSLRNPSLLPVGDRAYLGEPFASATTNQRRPTSAIHRYRGSHGRGVVDSPLTSTRVCPMGLSIGRMINGAVVAANVFVGRLHHGDARLTACACSVCTFAVGMIARFTITRRCRVSPSCEVTVLVPAKTVLPRRVRADRFVIGARVV